MVNFATFLVTQEAEINLFQQIFIIIINNKNDKYLLRTYKKLQILLWDCGGNKMSRAQSLFFCYPLPSAAWC